MEDLFKNTFLCKDCNKKMKLTSINKKGFNLRAVECKECNNVIVHPSDEKEYEEFKKLKEKEYGVKMRLVGNSYTVSIPREIVSFMREQERMIDDMVKLSMMDMGGLNLRFHTEDNEDEFKDLENGRRVVSREVRVVRNGKPVYHKKEYSDSANPQKNKKVEYSAEEDSN